MRQVKLRYVMMSSMILTFCFLFIQPMAIFAAATASSPGVTMAKQATKHAQRWNTTDHSKHEILQQNFKTGPEVTKACLTCHTEAAAQFHKTIHWTWKEPGTDPNNPQGKGQLTVNNFCISIGANEPRCTSCHAGYDFKDKTFDFSDPTKVDCLVCHDQTGTYKKFPSGAGNPVTKKKVFKGNKKTYLPPEWNKVAQSVGRPSRDNCGTCHFNGGGGDGVKHGDLDSSLKKPSRDLDVHMSVDGQNFDCVRCHTTSEHQISGRIYGTPASEHRKSLIQDDQTSRITCESCHSATPHMEGSKANDHTDKVACQTCHIPEFAREKPTKMWWDWSKAGKKKNGKPFMVKDKFGKPAYFTKKGETRWDMNVKPEYFWYNGSIGSITAKDKIDPTQVTAINWPVGDMNDDNSRIAPFKVHRGKQPFDTVNNNLVTPKLFGKKGSGAYWADYDWRKSIEIGSAYMGLPFSGKFGFAETSYVYPTTHMVAPKEKALDCVDCHTQNNGRLAKLSGFYMPGRDSSGLLDMIGWIVFGLAFAGVFTHGMIRVFSKK